MRILSGKYKGKFIVMPKGIRPTQDKVRKALFDILGDIEQLCFLDLFAGSASVGFEAASRGAELALVEDNRICQAAITRNIELLDVKMCSLYPQDVFKAIEMLYKNKKKFDIVFLDPPYYKDMVSRHSLVPKAIVDESLAKKTLQILEAYDIVAPNAFIVVEHFKKDVLPANMAIFSMFKQAKYGGTLLSFYKKNG